MALMDMVDWSTPAKTKVGFWVSVGPTVLDFAPRIGLFRPMVDLEVFG